MIYKYFDNEIQSFFRPTVRMYVTGKILIDKSGRLKELTEYAGDLLMRKYRELSNFEIESMKYQIWDTLDDIKALYDEGDTGFDYVYFNNLNRVFDHYRKYINAEIMLGGTRLMMSDISEESGHTPGNSLSLVVTFDTVDEVQKAYSLLKDGATILAPIQSTTYSSCFVSLIDKFGMRWELMTEQTEG